MVVQCPHCSERYRVNEQNIPESGGRIRCPTCQETFVIHPERVQPASVHDSLHQSGFDEDRTSIVSVPSSSPAIAHDDEHATEVILPSDLEGFGPIPEDGTVEMRNPLSYVPASMWPDEHDDEEAITEIAPSRVAREMEPSGLDVSASDATFVQPVQEPATEISPPTFAAPSCPPVPTTAPKQTLLGMGALAASGALEGDVEPTASAPDASHQGPWRLKTSFGLNYDFADLKSLLNWMANRDDLDGFTLSADGSQFLLINDFPQIASALDMPARPAAPRSRVPDAPMGTSPSMRASVPSFGPTPVPSNRPGAHRPSGSTPVYESAPPSQPSFGASPAYAHPPVTGFGPNPAGHYNAPPRAEHAPQTIAPPSYQLPTSQDAKWHKLLWVIFFVLFLGCVGLGLQISGIVNFQQILGPVIALVTNDPDPPTFSPRDTPSVAPPAIRANKEAAEHAQDQAESDEHVAQEIPELSPEQERQVTILVEEARQSLKQTKLGRAYDKLTTAQKIDPSRFETYDLLAEVYDEMGQSEKAAEMRQEVSLLRHKAMARPSDEIDLDDAPIEP